MRYFSDVTKKVYDSTEELLKAEQEVKLEEQKKLELEQKEKEKKEKMAAERKARAAEVEEARKAMVASQNHYKKVLEAFVRDYKSYHYTTTDTKEIPILFDIFNPLFFDFKL